MSSPPSSSSRGGTTDSTPRAEGGNAIGPRGRPARAAEPARVSPGLRAAALLLVSGAALFTAPFLAVIDTRSTPPIDARVLALAGDLTTATLTRILHVVTAFGTLPVTSVVVLAGAAVLMVRRRPAAALGLVAGFIALVLAIDLIKIGVGRPRPPQADPSITTKSFPSGHAGNATAYTAVAVALAAGLGDRRARQRALVAAGLLTTLVIGATRPLLRVHYLTDVVGGWGLGCAIFALAAIVVLAVAALRQTDPGPESSSQTGTESLAGPGAEAPAHEDPVPPT